MAHYILLFIQVHENNSLSKNNILRTVKNISECVIKVINPKFVGTLMLIGMSTLIVTVIANHLSQ